MIEKQYNLRGLLYHWVTVSTLLLLAVVIILGRGRDLPVTAIVVTELALIVWLSANYTVKSVLLRHRQTAFDQFVASQDKTIGPTRDSRQPFAKVSISELRFAHNYYQSSNHYYGPDWVYGDVSYGINGETYLLHRIFQAGSVYYAAIITDLPRVLPHVFFDSKRSRRWQFRLHFARAGRHSLEGNFDSYFTTYFSKTYAIDSLSFITPDVMQAMTQAADYTIEIKGNKLCLFGPMRLDPATQIPDMAKKLTMIKQQLLDNILTYRDERLAMAEGRHNVAKLGVSLERSRFWTYLMRSIVIAYLVFFISQAL